MTEPAKPSTKAFAVLLLLAAVVGLVVSLAAWGFLELVYQTQVGVWDDLPAQLGYDDGAPLWWGVPVLGIAGLIVAFAIVRLPGNGGHVPAEGLKTDMVQPVELPGVMLAAVATIGLGVVLGPEAPLIALGGGLGILAVRLIPRDLPSEVSAVIAASGTFAALALIFDSPLVAAVLLIEATGIGGPRLPHGAGPWPARRRHRVARVDRLGIVDRAQLEATTRSARSTCPPSPARTWATSDGRSPWR